VTVVMPLTMTLTVSLNSSRFSETNMFVSNSIIFCFFRHPQHIRILDLAFDVLPSQRPQDLCDFETLVTLDSNLECYGAECNVDTVKVVEVLPGVY
jgi:hypothetical protein